MLSSVSFWILVWSAMFGLIIGCITHWILGVIVFFVLAGRSAMIGLVLDTISGSLRYHHDREDNRTKKIMESIAALRNTPESISSVRDMRLKKLR
jgi:hypothetical protein